MRWPLYMCFPELLCIMFVSLFWYSKEKNPFRVFIRRMQHVPRSNQILFKTLLVRRFGPPTSIVTFLWHNSAKSIPRTQRISFLSGFTSHQNLSFVSIDPHLRYSFNLNLRFSSNLGLPPFQICSLFTSYSFFMLLFSTEFFWRANFDCFVSLYSSIHCY